MAPVEALSEQLVQVRETIAADDDHLVAVHLLHAAAVVGNGLAQLGEDQVEHLTQAQGAAEGVGGRTEGLAVPAGVALGFEQSCVLDRRRGLRGKCRHELGELIVVEIGLELVERDDAGDAIAEYQRRADPAANASTTVQLTGEMRMMRHVAEDVLPLRAQHLDARVGLVVEVEAEPENGLRILETAPAHDHKAIVLDHLHGRAVVWHDSLQLTQNRLEGVLQAQRLPERLRDGEQGLGAQSRRFQLRDAVARFSELGDELGFGPPGHLGVAPAG